MKTKKQVLKENPQHRVLITAVTRSIGMESIEDVNNHGIDGGFNGFIYYSETHSFAMRYRKHIIRLLEEMVENYDDISVYNFVSGFRCLNMDHEDEIDFYKFMGGGKPDQCSITNAMAWFAAEEVCRMFEE